ncbi:MAG: TraB/GumN family protein [Betaproteobacteria bacterium]
MTRTFSSREGFVRAAASLLVALLALAAMGAAQAQGERRGFLFEIRKGSQASLLFGTVHVGRPDFYPLPASRMSRLARVDALVLEADISDMARAAAATQKHAMYGQGEDGLDKRLPPATLKRAEAALARHGVDARPMMRLKPWMLASTLALFEAAQAGYLQGLGVESWLVAWAKSGNLPILEFEGIDQQFSLFESAPWSTQVAFLDEALQSLESKAAQREIDRIVRAWETADRPALERLLSEMQAQTSVGARFTVDTILFGRHPAMVRRIDTLMADGRNYLFAVGALHLVGPRGLVEMLRAQGYTVTEL